MDKEKKKQLASDLAQAVGMAIRLQRTERRLSLDDVAAQTGITKAALSRIENGETDMKMSTLAVLRSVLALELSISKVTINPSEIEPLVETDSD